MKTILLVLFLSLSCTAEVLREDFHSSSELKSHWNVMTWATISNTGDTVKAYKAENVLIENDLLKLKLQASPPGVYPRCGEVQLKNRKFLYGSFRASIKTSAVLGGVVGFFVYKHGIPGDGNLHEVDFEILTRQAQKMWFTLHHDAYSVDSKTYMVSFNPFEDFHEYRFDWYRDSVSYFIDGVQVGKLTKNVPDDSTSLLLNYWSENRDSWGGAAPTETSEMQVDYVEYRSLDELQKQDLVFAKLPSKIVRENSQLKYSSPSPSLVRLLNSQGKILWQGWLQDKQSVDLDPWLQQKLYIQLFDQKAKSTFLLD